MMKEKFTNETKLTWKHTHPDSETSPAFLFPSFATEFQITHYNVWTASISLTVLVIKS